MNRASAALALLWWLALQGPTRHYLAHRTTTHPSTRRTPEEGTR